MKKQLSPDRFFEKLPQIGTGLSVIVAAIVSSRKAFADQIIQNLEAHQPTNTDTAGIGIITINGYRIAVAQDREIISSANGITKVDISGQISECSVSYNQDFLPNHVPQAFCIDGPVPTWQRPEPELSELPVNRESTLEFSNGARLHSANFGGHHYLEKEINGVVSDLQFGTSYSYIAKFEGVDIILAFARDTFNTNQKTIILAPLAPTENDIEFSHVVGIDPTITLGDVPNNIDIQATANVEGIAIAGTNLIATVKDGNQAYLLVWDVNPTDFSAVFVDKFVFEGSVDTTGSVKVINFDGDLMSSNNQFAIFNDSVFKTFNLAERQIIVDADEDGVSDADDNCLNVPNADQADTDSDGVGDACEPVIPPTDTDGDGVADADDNCPNVPNADQADIDFNGVGDACDEQISADSDGDGIPDEDDNCPYDYDRTQANADFDSYGDVCDPCPEDASNQCTTTSTCDGFVSEPCVLASIEYCYEIGTNPVPGKTDCSILNNVQVTSCIANFDACRCDAVAPIFFHEKSGESCSLSTPIQCSDGSLITRGKIEETMNNNNCEAFVDEDTCEIQCTLDSECVGSTCPTDVDAGTDAEDDTGIVAPDAGNESDTGVAPDAVGNDVFTAPPKAEQPKEGCTVVGVSHNETPASISETTGFAVFVAFLMAVYQQSRHHTKQ